MCKKVTLYLALTSLALTMAIASGQAPASDWRPVGNTLRDLSLAGLAGGPVSRVWFSEDGQTLFAKTREGKVFQTLDRESWSASQAPEPAQWEPPISLAPEFGARTRPGKNGKLYAFGQFVYSSWSGANWDNLTAVRVPGGLASLVGRGIVDLAASPRDTGLGEEELAIAGEAGVFRSIDGGKSWSAINAGLPNFPGRRIAALPNGDRGVQVETSSTASRIVEWVPGERQAWRPTVGGVTADEISLRMALSASALKVSGPTVYYGFEDGTIRVSTGQVSRKPTDGRIANLWADQGDPRIAMAAVEGATRRVLRTIDGGLYWEDISTNLPAGEVHGVAASRSSRAVYVATDQGIFQAEFDVENLGAPPVWRALPGLPVGKVWDVRLDQGENRLWALTDGTGIFTTLAPHRYRDPRVLSSADFVARAAAPGALFSVAGAKISSARSGDIAIPILNASDSESQIQIPFEARGNTLSISIDSPSGRRTLASLPLNSVSPAIQVGTDGAPVLLDGDTRMLLDTMNPARSRAHVQIVATGLGRVVPDWPTATPAPLENPPKVAGTVRAYLDRQPVEVTRATLAEGYIGTYLVEIEIPQVVNFGAAELYLEIDGQASNRVRVFLEP